MLIEILMLFLTPVAEAGACYTHYAHMNAVNDVAVADGAVWCATSGGVVQWDIDAGEYRAYDCDDGINAGTSAICAEGGLIYCSDGQTQVLMLENGKWREHPSGIDGCDTIAVDGSGRHWFGREHGGLAMWDGENLEWFSPYTTDGGLASNAVYDILPVGGEVWFATDVGLSVLDGVTWRNHNVESGLPGNEVRDIEYTSDGTMWAVTDKGVAKFDGDMWKSVPFDNTGRPFLNDDVYIVTAVNGKNAYFGTHRYGMVMYDGDVRIIDTDSSPLLDNYINALAVTPGGSVLVSAGVAGHNTKGTGLLALTDGEWQTYLCDGPLSNLVSDVAIGSDGAVYCKSVGGIAGYDGELWSYYTGVEYSSIWSREYASVVDASGILWYIDPMGNGVIAVEGNEEKHYTETDGLADDSVSTIAVGLDNTVWFATENGVTSFDSFKWAVWNGAGTPGAASMSDITVDKGGAVWVAARDGGLWRYDGSWSEVICGGDVWRVEADMDGTLWVSLYPSGLFRYLDGVRMNAGELSGLQVIDIAADSSGRVWFATSHGLILEAGEITTSVDEMTNPEAFSPRAYPNPFNPSTTIAFSLAEAGCVTLDVYSITGQKVATLVDTPMSPGMHTAVFDGSGYASGMYFYRLSAGGTTHTGKMLLMK